MGVANKPEDILILDYGVGNIGSVANALTLLEYPHVVSGSRDALKRARTVIFPGVGSFGEAMGNLRKLDLIGPLSERVLGEGVPILGICLGMQLFADESDEGGLHKGLGWIPGRVARLSLEAPARVPHVGWNDLRVASKEPLFGRMADRPHFYFDHGYHYECLPRHVLATVDCGREVVAAVGHKNIFGAQFHPEKSQNDGLRLFRGFLNFALGAAHA